VIAEWPEPHCVVSAGSLRGDGEARCSPDRASFESNPPCRSGLRPLPLDSTHHWVLEHAPVRDEDARVDAHAVFACANELGEDGVVGDCSLGRESATPSAALLVSTHQRLNVNLDVPQVDLGPNLSSRRRPLAK
jgi:hypothetical protein